MPDKGNEELRNILEKMVSEHVTIPWKSLPDDSPIKKFAQSYNYYHDECGEGEGWAETVLTALTNAKTVGDLSAYSTKFTASDWYICSQLLKSGFSVRSELIGELIEKLLVELSEIKVDVSVLGIKKAKRGRPSNDTARRTYLGWLMFEIRRLTTEGGMSANQAYEHIGKQKNKAADTIRRDHERHMKEREHRRKELALKKTTDENGEGEK